MLRRFIGGVGLAAYLMHRESQAGVDPLAAEALLIFSLSPLVGTPLTTSAKFAVVAKSPLTDRLNDALSSSHFAIAAKRSGCDALVITGKCPHPALLVIDDGQVRLLPAHDLWGLPVGKSSTQLEAQLGPRFHTAVIGPAGENLVLPGKSRYPGKRTASSRPSSRANRRMDASTGPFAPAITWVLSGAHSRTRASTRMACGWSQPRSRACW